MGDESLLELERRLITLCVRRGVPPTDIETLLTAARDAAGPRDQPGDAEKRLRELIMRTAESDANPTEDLVFDLEGGGFQGDLASATPPGHAAKLEKLRLQRAIAIAEREAQRRRFLATLLVSMLSLAAAVASLIVAIVSAAHPALPPIAPPTVTVTAPAAQQPGAAR